MATTSKKILVHSCCVACASHVFSQLKRSGFTVIAYFYNPEIEDKEEYERRLSDLQEYCTESKIELISEKYGAKDFSSLTECYKDSTSIKFISDKDRYRRKRCYLCNSMLIQKTIEQAKKRRLKFFTTTLLCSPYKNHDEVVEIANEKALDYHMSFYYQDFRKGYWMGRNYARNHDAHIPAYCGCLESAKERRLE